MNLIDGKQIAAEIKAKIAGEVEEEPPVVEEKKSKKAAKADLVK